MRTSSPCVGRVRPGRRLFPLESLSGEGALAGKGRNKSGDGRLLTILALRGGEWEQVSPSSS